MLTIKKSIEYDHHTMIFILICSMLEEKKEKQIISMDYGTKQCLWKLMGGTSESYRHRLRYTKRPMLGVLFKKLLNANFSKLNAGLPKASEVKLSKNYLFLFLKPFF